MILIGILMHLLMNTFCSLTAQHAEIIAFILYSLLIILNTKGSRCPLAPLFFATVDLESFFFAYDFFVSEEVLSSPYLFRQLYAQRTCHRQSGYRQRQNSHGRRRREWRARRLPCAQCHRRRSFAVSRDAQRARHRRGGTYP